MTPRRTDGFASRSRGVRSPRLQRSFSGASRLLYREKIRRYLQRPHFVGERAGMAAGEPDPVLKNERRVLVPLLPAGPRSEALPGAAVGGEPHVPWRRFRAANRGPRAPRRPSPARTRRPGKNPREGSWPKASRGAGRLSTGGARPPWRRRDPTPRQPFHITFSRGEVTPPPAHQAAARAGRDLATRPRRRGRCRGGSSPGPSPWPCRGCTRCRNACRTPALVQSCPG